MPGGGLPKSNEMITNQENPVDNRRPVHRRNDGGDRYIVLRNILNIIFMIGAIAGVLVYFYGNRDTGTIIILVSMVFKIVECVFRFMK